MEVQILMLPSYFQNEKKKGKKIILFLIVCIYIKERGVYTETIFLVFLLIIFLIFILKIVFEVRQKEALGLAEKNRQYSGNISWCNQKRVFMKVLEIGFHPPQKKKTGWGGQKVMGDGFGRGHIIMQLITHQTLQLT